MIRENSLLLEAYKFNNADEAYNAIKTKKLGVKVPNFLLVNDEKLDKDLKEKLASYFRKASSLRINDPTYGVQFLISHIKSFNDLALVVDNDALYTYLQNYKKPWVKQLQYYNEFVNKPYNSMLWHWMEKEIQDNLDKHGKSKKGSGTQDDVKILYPKDSNGWELKSPLSFNGSKAAAFYGKQGEIETPTHWCTRASEDYYNQYTDNNKYPLYIIRNYKTGKAYQIASKINWDGSSYIAFLDQNDENGDEVTNGDLSKIPDNLLKLIKIGARGKTLLDYKHSPKADPNENKKGFINTNEKKEIVNAKIVEVPKRVIDNCPGIDKAELSKEMKALGPIVKGINRNAHVDNLDDDDEKDGAKQIQRFADTGAAYTDKGWRKKSGVRNYFFKNFPDIVVVVKDDKLLGIKYPYSIHEANEKLREKGFGNDLLSRLKAIAAFDSGVYKDLKGELVSPRHKRAFEPEARSKEVDAKLIAFLKQLSKKYFPDENVTILPAKSVITSTQRLAANGSFIRHFDVNNGEKGEAYFNSIGRGKYTLRYEESDFFSKNKERFQKLFHEANRYYRQLISPEILKTRAEGKFATDGVYESIENMLDNLVL